MHLLNPWHLQSSTAGHTPAPGRDGRSGVSKALEETELSSNPAHVPHWLYQLGSVAYLSKLHFLDL